MADKPTQEQKIRSAEASQLRDNPAFQRAVLGAKKRCLEQLADVDPHGVDTIRAIQAQIRAIDNLAEFIADEITRGLEPRHVAAA
jgi:hypothetical protein